jgi:hypothetical protein
VIVHPRRQISNLAADFLHLLTFHTCDQVLASNNQVLVIYWPNNVMTTIINNVFVVLHRYEMSEDEESLLQGWKSDDEDEQSR